MGELVIGLVHDDDCLAGFAGLVDCLYDVEPQAGTRGVKGEWNFKGWVTTDYNAAKSTSDLVAGTDQDFLTSFLSGKNLIPLIDPAAPSYDKAYADAAKEAVARIVYQYERFGLLDNAKIPRTALGGQATWKL